jgi:hypothetical protein
MQESNSTTTSPLDHLFNIFEHCYSTRTSDAHRAVDIESGDAVMLWRLRYPIEGSSDIVSRFNKRMEKVQALKVAMPKILKYGVDQNGIAFVSTQFIRGKSLFESQFDVTECQRLFHEAVRAVAEFHSNGIILGDICEASIIKMQDGNIMLQGVLGPFDVEAKDTSLLPSAQTLQFLSPEQRSGAGVEMASDVYSLGAYGYRLFSGRYLFGDKPPPLGIEEMQIVASSPSSVRAAVPLWVDDILGRCLELQPDERYASAKELREDFQNGLSSGAAKRGGGRWSKRTLIVQEDAVKAVRKKSSAESKRRAREEREKSINIEEGAGPNLALLILAPAIIIGVVLAVGIFLYVDSPKQLIQTPLEQEILALQEAAPAEIKESMQEIISSNLSLERRREAINKIASSNDPVAYAVLISVLDTAPENLKASAQQALVDRIHNQGLVRSSATIAEWFQALTRANYDPSKSPAYVSLLNACNPMLPLDRRRFALNQAYTHEPLVSVQLAAALSFDEDVNNFAPVLKQLLSAQLGRDDLDRKSLGVLILSSSMLTHAFRSDIDKIVESFSADELASVLLELAKNNNPLIFSIASETLKRNVVPEYQAVFLKAMIESSQYELSQPVKLSLVRGVRGEITESDIIHFGRWISIESEAVLLSICAIASDESIALSAFDTLAAKTIREEPINTFIELIKNHYWQHRRKLVKAIGIIGHYKIATDEQIQYAFDILIPYIGVNPLFKATTSSKNDKLIILALERFLEVVPAPQLIELLSHPKKEVRMLAVKGLQNSNELAILQRILRAYNNEKDEEVREAYNKYHWVTVEDKHSG